MAVLRMPSVGCIFPGRLETGCCTPRAGLRGDVRAEWDETKQHDVLFLLTLRPPPAHAVAAARAGGGEPTPAELYGLIAVRGCEVIEVPNPRGSLQGSDRRPCCVAVLGHAVLMLLHVVMLQPLARVLSSAECVLTVSMHDTRMSGAVPVRLHSPMLCIRGALRMAGMSKACCVQPSSNADSALAALQVKDEEGRLMNDFTGRVKREEWQPPAGLKRTLVVALDTAQYQMDMEAMQASVSEDVYSTFNLLVRRKPKVGCFPALPLQYRCVAGSATTTPLVELLQAAHRAVVRISTAVRFAHAESSFRFWQQSLETSSHSGGCGGEQENNFKAVLESIRDLMNEDTVMPAWLHDIFLGYGDPAAARYTNLPDTLDTIDFKDTFLDAAHLRASFPGHEVHFKLAGGSSVHEGEANGSAHVAVNGDADGEPRPPFRVMFVSAAASVAPAAKPGKGGKRKVRTSTDLLLRLQRCSTVYSLCVCNHARCAAY